MIPSNIIRFQKKEKAFASSLWLHLSEQMLPYLFFLIEYRYCNMKPILLSKKPSCMWYLFRQPEYMIALKFEL